MINVDHVDLCVIAVRVRVRDETVRMVSILFRVLY